MTLDHDSQFLFGWGERGDPIMSFVMDSPLRRKLNDPLKTLAGARVKRGQKVLEVGCGTGYFTVSAAKLVGDSGLIYAIDSYPPAIEMHE